MAPHQSGGPHPVCEQTAARLLQHKVCRTCCLPCTCLLRCVYRDAENMLVVYCGDINTPFPFSGLTDLWSLQQKNQKHNCVMTSPSCQNPGFDNTLRPKTRVLAKPFLHPNLKSYQTTALQNQGLNKNSMSTHSFCKIPLSNTQNTNLIHSTTRQILVGLLHTNRFPMVSPTGSKLYSDTNASASRLSYNSRSPTSPEIDSFQNQFRHFSMSF